MKEVAYPAPDFSLLNSDGVTRTLKDYKGSWLVLYFYPKDDTPGCTIEACSLRDARDDIVALGAQVVGVSMDNAVSHQKFKAHHDLNFELLSDSSGEMIKSYGAWGKKMFGREGILRKTFIINPDSQVVKVYAKVTPLGHGEAIVNDVKDLQQGK